MYELPTAANVTFSGIGNLLEIDSAAQFSSSGDVISGFGRNEAIELVGVAFSSASTISLTTSNVLVISANGSSYSFHLDPSANYSGGTFGLFSAAGGADTVIGFNQQPITNGGTATVSAGVVANLAVYSGGVDDVLSGGTASGNDAVQGRPGNCLLGRPGNQHHHRRDPPGLQQSRRHAVHIIGRHRQRHDDHQRRAADRFRRRHGDRHLARR